jgi:hypothetical protein
MNSQQIVLTRKWSDDDIAELVVRVSDGVSSFVNSVYVSHGWATDCASALATFSRQVHGGIYDFKAGQFGPEYANGAFLARFHYYRPNLLYVSTFQQSEFHEFKRGEVAPEARLFLRTEPVLIDRFIDDLPSLERDDGEEVILECIGL